jgi:hypothetical protein
MVFLCWPYLRIEKRSVTVLSKDIERIEREAVQRQDADWQRQLREAAEAPAPATMQGFAVAEASQSHGRFTQVQASTVVGSKADVASVYPAASSAHQTELPPEPPLGVDINEMAPLDPVPEPGIETVEAQDPGGAASAPSSPASDVEHPAPPLSSEEQHNG